MFEPPHDLKGEFIDAVVRDPARADALLAAHPDLINARWVHDETPLHFLAIEGYADGVRFLAERGATVDATNEFGATALLEVASIGDVEMTTLLLQLGANPNVTSPTCDNLLHHVMRSESPTMVALLLDAGADARAVTEWGETLFDVLDTLATNTDEIAALLAARGIVRE